MTLRARAAAVRWGYLDVLTLADVVITSAAPGGGPRRWTATGVAGRVDPWRATQGPLVLVVPHPGGAWRWAVVSQTVTAGRWVASVSREV